MINEIDLSIELDQIFSPEWQYNDAGRNKTKWRGQSDCGVRAVALALNLPYNNARKLCKEFTNIGKAGNRAISTGIYKSDMDLLMESFGWFYHKMPKNSYLCNLPQNIKAICDMPKHFVYIENGILQDTWDSTNRKILGYWIELND